MMGDGVARTTEGDHGSCFLASTPPHRRPFKSEKRQSAIQLQLGRKLPSITSVTTGSSAVTLNTN
jgi:hypothetical protein